MEIRENQIRQIQEEDNRLKKIILERMRQANKDYVNNKVVPQIIDETIVNTSKTEARNFIDLINELLIIFASFDGGSQKELFSTYANRNRSEFRKLQNAISIVKPMRMWEDFIKKYTSPKVNVSTRELMVQEFIKILPFVSQLCDYLLDNVFYISKMYQYRLYKDVFELEKEDGFITEEEYKKQKDMFLDNVIKYIIETDLSGFSAEEIKQYKDDVNSTNYALLLTNLILALAFYRNLKRQIEKNLYNNITKSDIVFEVAQILKDILLEFNDPKLYNYIITDVFKDSEIPELSPFFQNNRDEFGKLLDELDDMQGIENVMPNIEARQEEEEEEEQPEGEAKEEEQPEGEAKEEEEQPENEEFKDIPPSDLKVYQKVPVKGRVKVSKKLNVKNVKLKEQPENEEFKDIPPSDLKVYQKVPVKGRVKVSKKLNVKNVKLKKKPADKARMDMLRMAMEEKIPAGISKFVEPEPQVIGKGKRKTKKFIKATEPAMTYKSEKNDLFSPYISDSE